jgi:hypothetical protein
VTELSQADRWFAGQLQKGDCVAGEPDSRFYNSDTLLAPVVDCSLPHSDQVAGFVDVLQDMSTDSIEREIAVAQRCNSLIASLPAWEDMGKGVKASYPEQEELDKGVGVAICWIPIFNKTWVGSVMDQTAELVR